jgi:hypothetical protein
VFPLVGIPRRTVALAGLLSAGLLLFALSRDWPIWAVGAATLAPWLPLLVAQTAWTYQRYQWLALFYALVVTQTGHFLEHVAQMIQLHLLGLTGAGARGVFGALDIEWVHFIWNTWVIAAVLTLLWRYRANRWLWLTAVLSGWHELEHLWIFSVYLTTGVSGTPGLLSQGGALGGGLPIARADLHFFYNLVETLPLALAFFQQAQHVSTSGRLTPGSARASAAARRCRSPLGGGCAAPGSPASESGG